VKKKKSFEEGSRDKQVGIRTASAEACFCGKESGKKKGPLGTSSNGQGTLLKSMGSTDEKWLYPNLGGERRDRRKCDRREPLEPPFTIQLYSI